MIFLIAIRNLTRNVKNSLLILTLLLVIMTLFFLGNTLLEETNHGLGLSYRENYTGDLVIKSRSEIAFSIFGANTPAIGEYFSIPVLKNHQKIQTFLESLDFIKNTVSQISGVALMDIQKGRYKVPLFGINGGDYLDFFKGIKILEGGVFADGEEGILITSARINRIEQERGIRPVIGDPVLLTMVGNNGFKIREVPLKGIYTYKSSNKATEEIVLVDAQTLRALNSITLASTEEVTENNTLFSGSIDDLFGVDDIETEEDESFSVDSVLHILTEPSAATSGELIGGSWNFILLRLQEGYSHRKAIKQLNTLLEEREINAEVINWRNAAGLPALLVLLLQILYNGGFLLVLVAGIIAIINILVISVFERTGEIGTLRAMGASKSFIVSLFYIENLLLSLLAGILAVVVGFAVIQLINKGGITINNSLIVSLLGDSIINIRFIPSIALISVAASILLGFLSTIFPVQMALKIEPVSAMAKG